jgi:hypothetical protein
LTTLGRLQRALRILGSEAALAERLSVSPAMLRHYLSGEVQPSDTVFLRAVDVLFNHAFTGVSAQRRLVRYDAESHKAMQAAKAVRAEVAATRLSHRPAFAHRLFDPHYRSRPRARISATSNPAGAGRPQPAHRGVARFR